MIKSLFTTSQINLDYYTNTCYRHNNIINLKIIRPLGLIYTNSDHSLDLLLLLMSVLPQTLLALVSSHLVS
ncbi:MAG TPA: hypothetical protein VMW32_04340, partial [Bacteroidales bacterium]|nr:hypothetical protein [Bacteroidales bacterium]